MKKLKRIGINAKKALTVLNNLNGEQINKTLLSYNQILLKNKKQILQENIKDIKSVKRKHLIDRLMLDDKRIDGIRSSINEIIKFKNPLNKVLEEWKRPNGLKIKKITTPIGVIGVIYESRPNVTADVAALCLKSGNCGILRGGSEAYNSNKILADLFRASLKKIILIKTVFNLLKTKIEILWITFYLICQSILT